MALIYTDDVILVGNNKDKIKEVKLYINNKFSIKDIGPLKYFSGIKITQSSHRIVLSQRKYALDILEESGMQGCRLSAFPIGQNHKLRVHKNGTLVDAT